MKGKTRGYLCPILVFALLLPLAVPGLLPSDVSRTDPDMEDQIIEFRANPASEELLNHYWEMKIKDFGDLLALLYPSWPPTSLFKYCDYLVAHDTGLMDGRYSIMAKDYLENEVLLPLAKIAGFEAESVSDLRKLNLAAKRELAEVFYIWSRDGAAFADMAFDKIAIALFVTLPGMLFLVLSLMLPFDIFDTIFRYFTTTNMNVMDMIPIPFLIKSPVETAHYGNSHCMGKALLLASLLEMIGLKVGLGFIGAQVIYTRAPQIANLIPKAIQYIPAIGHTFVMLKDPGWGIGRWVVAPGEEIVFEMNGITYGSLPEKDMVGRAIEGNYLLLEPTYSELFNPLFPPLGFDENFPDWLGLNPNELAFGLLN